MKKLQTRRDWLYRLGSSVGTMAFATTWSSLGRTCRAMTNAIDQPGWKTAIGLNGFDSSHHKYGTLYTIDEIIKFAKDAGFDGLELIQGWPFGNYPSSKDKEAVDKLIAYYHSSGLQPFSIQIMADGAFDPEDGARKEWLKLFEDRVQLAKKLGAAHVGLWPVGGLRGQSLDKALEYLGNSFREALNIATSHDIVPGFEIEPPFVFNTVEHMQQIIDRSGMKFIYDPSHCDLMHGSVGRPHEVLEKLGVQRVAYVHLTDTDGTLRDGGTSKHLAAGDGHAQLEVSLRMLKEGGFQGWIMCDAWEIPDPYDACRKAKSMIERIRVE